MQDYGMCKRELEKAINLLEISHAKYKHLENYAQLLYDKSKKSNETGQKFIESCKSYIYKWICLITEANRNQKLVEVGVKLKNKRILKQGFESLKLNLKWEKFIKRNNISRDTKSKMICFDSLKLNNINMKNNRKLELKRRVLSSLHKHYVTNRLPADVEQSKLEICSKFYENKVKTKSFKAFRDISIGILKLKRVSIEKAEKFYKCNQFALVVKILKQTAERMKISDQANYYELKRKRETQLKVMAFSSLLWNKNTSTENRRKLYEVSNLKQQLIVSQCFFNWKEIFEKKKKENSIYKQISTNHNSLTIRQCFKGFRHIFRRRVLLKKLYFNKWLSICRIEKREIIRHKVHNLKLNNFKVKQIKTLMMNVFNAIRINCLSTRSKKYFKEQESLRRCLKEDLEEKAKLKRRINDLILECKEKQMKLVEIEMTDSMKTQSSKILEMKCIEEFKKTLSQLSKTQAAEKENESDIIKEYTKLKAKTIKLENELITVKYQLNNSDGIQSYSNKKYQPINRYNIENYNSNDESSRVQDKIKQMQEIISEYSYKNRILSRELDYSNRQVEELKRLLVCTDSPSSK